MSRCARIVVAFVISIGVAGATRPVAPAFAQAPPPPKPATPAAPPRPLAESLTGEAKADYEGAKLLFADGDFNGALSKFKQAYDKSKDPRLLWNMAVCEKNLRHYYKLQVLVRKYLEDGKGLLTPEQETQARELIDAVQSFIAVLDVRTTEAGAEIAIDGEPAGTTPLSAPLPIDLGTHTITVTKSGFLPFTKEIEVQGGSTATLDAPLSPDVTTAHLVVVASPGNAISFDGRVVADGRWESNVPAGPHLIRVTASGMKPYESRIDFAKGTNRTLTVTLEKERSMPWLWIAGGAVVATGLVVGGYFLFRPEDQQAPQPQGSLSPGLINLSR
jgi:hypothetical protein